MKKAKSLILFALVIGLGIILYGWISMATNKEFDNVTYFTIKNGEVVKYNGNQEVCELPYTYKTVDGKAVFGDKIKVVSLGANAFAEKNEIKRLAISNNIATIKDDAFNHLDKLEKLVLRGDNPPQISKSEIEKLPQSTQIYVYSKSYDKYLSDLTWKQFRDRIQKL